ASQKYFTIHCERRIFHAWPDGFRANNAQSEGLVLAAIEPQISVANCISENRISSEERSAQTEVFPWLWQLATPLRISKPKRPKAKSTFTTGSAATGGCCSRTRRT